MEKSDLLGKSASSAKPLRPEGPDVEAARIEKTEVPAVAGQEVESPAPATRPRPVKLIEGAKQQLKEMTGYPVDSIVGFGKSGDGWALTVSVVELSRIPAASDVLAEYVVDLDAWGDVTGYRRGRRFYRGEVGEVE